LFKFALQTTAVCGATEPILQGVANVW